ncbi:protein FAR1-RELATED SEQUENCE 5-like [Abrus precatorius]|uniref:Protein FAR1-RELATED SEQUENCE n=1 Tax=Abrus precatorius TaxID=3816 RepID=A0A8B8L418_ABRPR|nr:protein FAR1-RELATED SEQUENCE 5-like [Abrus precatorius]
MDAEEQITNVFWADAKMVIDYGFFGEVVSLDTTYCTNRANRPLALFSGFNHYRGVVIFGAALLYDETAESFQWLFETFLEAHNNKKSQTLFTDQDQAMAKALVQVMPETRHALCTWHLMQNGIKHLGNLMKGGSHFLRDLKRCIYDFDTSTEFEEAWIRLITEYNVQEHTWITSLYAIKEKWASCYLKDCLTHGMRSTQLSESLNSDFKACMRPGVDIKQFFEHFERVVEDKRYNELKCEYDSRHKLAMLRYEISPILIQMAKVYTNVVYNLFQQEFAQFLACCISQRIETPHLIEYVITKVNQQRSWTVTFDRSSTTINCSCKKFETFGILCCHALKVFEANDVKVIPDKYILKRWTTQGRCGIIHNVKGIPVEGDPKLSTTRRYRHLACKMIRLASEVSSLEEYCQLVNESINTLIIQITKFRLQPQDNDNNNNDGVDKVNIHSIQPKGFKHRPTTKRKGCKRFKSWVELQAKKKNKSPTLGQSASQEYQPMLGSSFQVHCSAPPYYDPPETFIQQLSFTDLLKEQLDDTNTSILDQI